MAWGGSGRRGHESGSRANEASKCLRMRQQALSEHAERSACRSITRQSPASAKSTHPSPENGSRVWTRMPTSHMPATRPRSHLGGKLYQHAAPHKVEHRQHADRRGMLGALAELHRKPASRGSGLCDSSMSVAHGRDASQKRVYKPTLAHAPWSAPDPSADSRVGVQRGNRRHSRPVSRRESLPPQAAQVRACNDASASAMHYQRDADATGATASAASLVPVALGLG